MGIENDILRLLQYLQNEGIGFTNDFVKDIGRLILTDVEAFASQFYKDFTRKEFKNYNRFEKLKLTKQQRLEIENRTLWRYEYRKTSNFRCIFILEKNEDNKEVPILLCAFNENGGKKKGENSYEYNIKRAIKIIKKNCVEGSGIYENWYE